VPSPAEFEVDGVGYRCLRLSAAQQHALLRLVTPLLPLLSSVDIGVRLPNVTPMALATLLAPLRDVDEAKLRAVFDACLQACERLDGAEVGRPSLAALIAIVMQVASAQFTPLWTMARPTFDPVPSSPNDKGFGAFGPVEMPDGTGELYRPMVEGLCTYRELHDGTLQIEDVARMQDVLTVKAENEARLRYVAEAG
jgi:hypothetical protein